MRRRPLGNRARPADRRRSVTAGKARRGVDAITRGTALLAGPNALVLDPRTAPRPTELPAGLTEEQQIGSAKFQGGEGGEIRPRVFEEERFLFPETYGKDRVRLMVKDPENLFAFWDVSAATWKSMQSDIGERATALSRLTLKVTDAVSGGDQVILVPAHARAWYVKADAGRRSYRAEIGLTLPSGRFRSIAKSSTVLTPWQGPSPEAASRVARFGEPFVDVPLPAAPRDAPWRTEPVVEGPLASARVTPEPGGASDAFRPSVGDASDALRPSVGGASDTFRR